MQGKDDQNKVYVGPRTGFDSKCPTVCVFDGGDHRSLPLRLDLHEHSPSGLEWAYGNKGPAQLALAILSDLTGSDEYAVRHHHWFKFDVISSLPWEGLKLNESRARAWIAEHHPLGR